MMDFLEQGLLLAQRRADRFLGPQNFILGFLKPFFFDCEILEDV
jgi:hypothetical protein